MELFILFFFSQNDIVDLLKAVVRGHFMDDIRSLSRDLVVLRLETAL